MLNIRIFVPLSTCFHCKDDDAMLSMSLRTDDDESKSLWRSSLAVGEAYIYISLSP